MIVQASFGLERTLPKHGSNDKLTLVSDWLTMPFSNPNDFSFFLISHRQSTYHLCHIVVCSTSHYVQFDYILLGKNVREKGS